MSRHRAMKGWIDDAMDDIAGGDYDEYDDYGGGSGDGSKQCGSCYKTVEKVYVGTDFIYLVLHAPSPRVIPVVCVPGV